MTEAGRSPGYDALHPDVQRWIWRQGWRSLRDVQERAVAPILAGDRDVVVAAATAAGKTEAAFLPIVSAIAARPRTGVRALYVAPLKALINDQLRRLEGLAEAAGTVVRAWHGDVPAAAKRGVLEDPSGLLLITPESLEALLVRHGRRAREVFAGLEWVVIDEMHAFLAEERGRQLQSLLHRLELMLRRRQVRVGLSATLGDMEIARRFLRPRDPGRVQVIEARGGGGELRLGVRAYLRERAGAEFEAIARHLFARLRGSSNLVFANSRAAVERLTAALRRLGEAARVPCEFFAHHGSLARELREELERALAEGERPVTAVCTSTLEMGIDLGDVASVAQVGAPSSVAALRQRLGRSGRRGGPAVLRVYVRESAPAADAPCEERLRASVVQTVAVLRLLLSGWCEPLAESDLHLSTLVQQVLALIAQFDGVRADEAWRALCASGPFAAVDRQAFSKLLRGLGRRGVLEQAADGTLLLGPRGERIVEDHAFYAVFRTDEEYRVVHGDRTLGTLPLGGPLTAGMGLILAGRRWRVREVDPVRKTVFVQPGSGGKAPRLEGGGARVHGRVRAEMRAVYTASDDPGFLDDCARELLDAGRRAFLELGLDRDGLVQEDEDVVLFPWAGDAALATLALQLRAVGYDASVAGLALRVEGAEREELRGCLRDLLDAGPANARQLASLALDKVEERYDDLLDEELLDAAFASRALDARGAWKALADLVGRPGGPG